MKQTLKVFLIDDEPAIPAVLKRLFALHIPQVEVVGEANSISDAIEQLAKTETDLIFLDVRMPGGTGFDVVKALPQRNFEIIFLTGYEAFALEAFRIEAADYLLKPVDRTELMQAIERVQKRLTLKKASPAPVEGITITVHEGDHVHRLPADEIRYLVAENNYTYLYTKTFGTLVIARTLGDLEEQLQVLSHFVRISRSVLINKKSVRSYSKHSPFILVMDDGATFATSRRRKTEVMKILEKN